MVREALEMEGGVEYLRWAARKKPVAFLALLGRLVPSEVRAQIDTTTLVIRDYSGTVHEVPFQRTPELDDGSPEPAGRNGRVSERLRLGPGTDAGGDLLELEIEL